MSSRNALPRWLRALPLWGMLLLCPGPAALQGDPILDFRRFFERSDDPASRVEAVLILSGYESARVVDELVPVLDDGDPAVVDAAVRVLGGFLTRPPVERMLELVQQGSLAERLGLLNGLARGGYGGLASALSGSLADNRWELRNAALAALGASRDPAVAALLEGFALDPEPAVRCAALEGLTPIAPEALLRCAPAALADASWQVRACAIAELARVRERRSVGLLIARLRAERGRLLQDLSTALTGLTGRSFGLAAEPWERFWQALDEAWAPPTEAALAELEQRRAVTRENYEGAGVVRFHGVQTPSRSILFVIDISASMAQGVVRAERSQTGEAPRRIDLVKQELARAIEELQPYVEFNILAFSTEVQEWKGGLSVASKTNKRAAQRWVDKLDAIVGASEAQHVQLRETVTPARLSSLLDFEGGRTNTYGALMQALGVAGRGAVDRHYELALDTILFLSDGEPTYGEVIAPDDILREVARANRLRRVVIHTIAIGEFNKSFLESLATQNGGEYVDLGK